MKNVANIIKKREFQDEIKVFSKIYCDDSFVAVVAIGNLWFYNNDFMCN